MNKCKTVEAFIKDAVLWQAELIELRKILNGSGLAETVKWGGPCYTHNGRNVVGLGAFKSYVGLWFFQGALLTDPERVLVNAQSGKTRAMRQWRFTSADQIEPKRIKAYLAEAMTLAAAGKEIKPDRNKPLVLPPELEQALGRNKAARAAFDKLTKGKKREYADYIGSAKRRETKETRLEKILPLIASGRGLNDKYRT